MYKNGFGIKWPTMFDMPQNQNEPKQTMCNFWGFEADS